VSGQSRKERVGLKGLSVSCFQKQRTLHNPKIGSKSPRTSVSAKSGKQEWLFATEGKRANKKERKWRKRRRRKKGRESPHATF